MVFGTKNSKHALKHSNHPTASRSQQVNEVLEQLCEVPAHCAVTSCKTLMLQL
jgi:hypothetical protein